ncbi:MAG: hypothetical protein GY722_08620 [bacterium]|nr:hypothetical protein [bacterium]
MRFTVFLTRCGFAAGPQIEINATLKDPGDVPGLLAGAAGYSHPQPAERDDGWQSATPEEVGLEGQRLQDLVRALIAGEADPERQLIVVTTGGNSYNGKSFTVLGTLAQHLYPGRD